MDMKMFGFSATNTSVVPCAKKSRIEYQKIDIRGGCLAVGVPRVEITEEERKRMGESLSIVVQRRMDEVATAVSATR